MSLFAAWRLGAAVTPVNPALSPQEVRYQLADAGAKVLIADELHQCEPAPADASRGNDASLALLIYTSGTTGRPKGVMLDHANLNAMCRSVIEGFSVDPRRPQPVDTAAVSRQRDRRRDAVAVAGRRPGDGGRALRPEDILCRTRAEPGHLFLRRTNDLHDVVRAARRPATGHVIGAVRGLRGCAGQRRVAGTDSNRATASRSSRATGCRREHAPVRSTRSTVPANRGQ